VKKGENSDMTKDAQGVIRQLDKQINKAGLRFAKKPILIGGMAMEYYGMRKAGADIDLVICEEDYQALASKYPDKRKDIWGDLGVVIGPFEIWRCIMLLDYDFYIKDAVDEGVVFVVSLDRLLLMRVFAMDVPKYMDDLRLMKDYYHRMFRNPAYAQYMQSHIASYQNKEIVWGGEYLEE